MFDSELETTDEERLWATYRLAGGSSNEQLGSEGKSSQSSINVHGAVGVEGHGVG